VIDTASAGSASRGLNPQESETVFQDQIEASKTAQYGLFSAWSAEPARAPTTAPDVNSTRSTLDRITGELLDALAATEDERAVPGCPEHLRHVLESGPPGQDGLHRLALTRATRFLCR
jgi:chorismate mutase